MPERYAEPARDVFRACAHVYYLALGDHLIHGVHVHSLNILSE